MRKKGSEKDRGRRERRRCIGREEKRVKVFTSVTVDNLHIINWNLPQKSRKQNQEHQLLWRRHPDYPRQQ